MSIIDDALDMNKNARRVVGLTRMLPPEQSAELRVAIRSMLRASTFQSRVRQVLAFLAGLTTYRVIDWLVS